MGQRNPDRCLGVLRKVQGSNQEAKAKALHEFVEMEGVSVHVIRRHFHKRQAFLYAEGPRRIQPTGHRSS